MAAPILFLALEGCKKTDGTANAGGSVSFRVPGQQTPAIVYSNSAGTAILSQPVTLDGYGKATVYVTSVVDMDIFDSTGVSVVSIERATAVHSGQVDVESVGFLGTGIVSGQTEAGGRTSLATIETRAQTSLGGTDFEYLDSSGGTSRPLKTVFRERGLSVKDRGALGDGLTVDTAAFVEAIALLKAAGGGVLLIPPGTYIIDDALLVSFSGLRIVGYGHNVSILKLTSTSTNLITVSGAYNFDIEGVQLTASAITTGYGISTVGSGQTFRGIKVMPYFEACIFLDTAAFFTEITHCNLQASAADKQCVLIQGNNTKAVYVHDNYFEAASAGVGTGVEIKGAGPVYDVAIENNNMGALGTGIKIDATATGSGYRVRGNALSESTIALDLGKTAQSLQLHESANTISLATVTEVTTIADASTTTLAGHYSQINGGTGTINLITATSWRKGAIAVLVFGGAVTVKHNQASAGFGLPVILDGAADFVAANGDSLTLVFDGSSFRELSRMVL